MTDNADVIRQYVDLYGPFPAGEHQRIVVAALDALVAEKDEALRRLETTGVVELHESYEAVRDALLDLIEYACRMPGYSLHPQTERAREVFEEKE